MELEKLEHFPLGFLNIDDQDIYNRLPESGQKVVREKFIAIYNDKLIPLLDICSTKDEYLTIAAGLIIEAAVFNFLESYLSNTIKLNEKE